MTADEVYRVSAVTGLLPPREVCVASSFALADREAVAYRRAHPDCSVFIDVVRAGVWAETYRTTVWP